MSLLQGGDPCENRHLPLLDRLHTLSHDTYFVPLQGKHSLPQLTPSLEKAEPGSDSFAAIFMGCSLACAMGWDFSASSSIDARGNLCVTPNPCRFQIYTREGDVIQKMLCKDIFREVDYIQDFSLTPDGKKAIILAGSYFIGELELPCTSAQRYKEEREKDASPEADSPGVIQEEEFIIIDGIRLSSRKGYNLLSLADSWRRDS